MRLEHPFIAGASPLGYHLDSVKRLEDAGCAAVVLHSLFEEQISRAYSWRVADINVYEKDFADILQAFPSPRNTRRVRMRMPSTSTASSGRLAYRSSDRSMAARGESWLRFARVIEQAGADALELNLYEVATQLNASSVAIEERIVNIVRDLKGLIKIPIAVKLSPFFTALGNLAAQLDAAGADGLVLFNRFYQPDFDIRTMKAAPQAELSTSAELLLRLRWIALLHGRIRPSLALSGGVAVKEDGIKAILAGADAVQVVSALLRHGPGYVATLRKGLEDWLAWHKMDTLDEARGLMKLASSDSASFERGHYIRTLHTWLP